MKHVHTDQCRWSTASRGDGRTRRICLTAGAERSKNRYLGQPKDGWEDDYGPVPNRVPDKEWYDRVVVLRALSAQRTGRWPTPPEWRDIFKRQQVNGTTDDELGLATLATSTQLVSMRNRYANE